MRLAPSSFALRGKRSARSNCRHVEDPNATDETLNDFTFSQNELQKELDEDRAHLGIKVSGMVRRQTTRPVCNVLE